MPEVLFHVDQSKSFYDQQVRCHNRWHPAAGAKEQAAVHPGTTGTAHRLHMPRLTWESPVKPGAAG